jgi:hypothetical protein
MLETACDYVFDVQSNITAIVSINILTTVMNCLIFYVVLRFTLPLMRIFF